MTPKNSEYMYWAKTQTTARYNLATSGMISVRSDEFPPMPPKLEINYPGSYGYPPLIELLANRWKVDTSNVFYTLGTSMANYILFATLLDPGNHVLIEQPTYSLLTDALRLVGANIDFFDRRFENDFSVEPDIIRKRMRPDTKLIVLTNLHNPSSALIAPDTLRDVSEAARISGALVVIDEVYLEATFGKRESAFHLADNILVTNSLTKVFGLSGLRCGWILAPPPVIGRFWHIADIMYGNPAHPAECLAVEALESMERFEERSKVVLEVNHPVLREFLRSRSDIRTFYPGFGTVVFPKLLNGSVERLASLLRNEYDTVIVPGSFFGMDDHFRIGIGCDKEILSEGLKRVGAALDRLG